MFDLSARDRHPVTPLFVSNARPGLADPSVSLKRSSPRGPAPLAHGALRRAESLCPLNCQGDPGRVIQPETLAQSKKTCAADEAMGLQLGWCVHWGASSLNGRISLETSQ
jgi:hypothetical protein